MKRLTLVALLLALSGGCAGRYYWHSHTHYDYAAYPTAPSQVVVSQPPPPVPVQNELLPPQPSANSVWVEGHWSYNGMWTWVDGTWVSGYSGWVWTPPVVVLVDNSYVFYRGYFRQPTYQPAPAYTHPNRIYISVRTNVNTRPGHAHTHQPPAQPQPRPADPPPQLERPRELEVPGAIVRTPPAPPAPAPHVPPPAANPQPERPVLVAPGATVSRRPAHTRPDQEPVAPVTPGPVTPAPVTPAPAQPPVLSNVPPVIERPAEPPKTPRTDTAPLPAPIVQAPAQPPKTPREEVAPTPAPVAEAPKQPKPAHPTPAPVPEPPPQVAPLPTPPTHVTPGGHASLPSRRSRPTPATPAPNQSLARPTRGPDRAVQNVAPSRTERSSRNTTAPSGITSNSPARSSRNSTFGVAPVRTERQTTTTRPQAAPTRSAPATTSTQRSKPARSNPMSTSSREGRSRKDAGVENKPAAKPAFTCTLVTTEAPRGGQLDVHGDDFGATPVVRIGGKVTRILRRNTTDIRVQIPRDSNGGAVTVTSNGVSVECGALTIIGTNR